MYVCLYVCLSVCMYICMYVCISILKLYRPLLCPAEIKCKSVTDHHLHVCLSVCLYVCMHVCVGMFVYISEKCPSDPLHGPQIPFFFAVSFA